MSAQTELAEYGAWLLRWRLTLQHRIPFYLLWVKRASRLTTARGLRHWKDGLTLLLSDLAASEAPDWQLRQAAEAITLFHGQFRSELAPEREADAGRPEDGDTGPVTPSASEGEALEEMAELLQLRHYARSTRKLYMGWAGRFFAYIRQNSGSQPCPADVRAFLSRLATQGRVSASTQNQATQGRAFAALLFLFRYVLSIDLEDMTSPLRAKPGARLPVVLSLDETRAVLSQVSTAIAGSTRNCRTAGGSAWVSWSLCARKISIWTATP